MRGVWKGVCAVCLAVALAGCGASSATKKEAEGGAYIPPAAKAAPSASLVSLLVEGATYPTLASFKRALAGVPGVNNVYQQSFSKDAASELHVEYQGTAQVLADAIQNLSTQALPIEVLGFDPSQIRLRLLPGQ
ncbi:MAG: hypothetical protein Kow0092_30100 [Deferrisomatales bacterium]